MLTGPNGEPVEVVHGTTPSNSMVGVTINSTNDGQQVPRGPFPSLLVSGQRRVWVKNPSLQYVWFGEWLPAPGLGDLGVMLEQRDAPVHLQSQIVLQTAMGEVEAPDEPALLGPAHTGPGLWLHELRDLLLYTYNKRFVRFGVAVSLLWGDNPDRVALALRIADKSPGR